MSQKFPGPTAVASSTKFNVRIINDVRVTSCGLSIWHWVLCSWALNLAEINIKIAKCDWKVNNVHLCQAMLKKQFQRRFENMQSGQAEKEEDLDSSMSDEGHQGSGRKACNLFITIIGNRVYSSHVIACKV